MDRLDRKVCLDRRVSWVLELKELQDLPDLKVFKVYKDHPMDLLDLKVFEGYKVLEPQVSKVSQVLPVHKVFKDCKGYKVRLEIPDLL
jgi:hypothetical protein